MICASSNKSHPRPCPHGDEEKVEEKGEDMCLIKEVPSQPNGDEEKEEDKEEEKGVSHQTSPIPDHVQMERKRRKNKKKRKKVVTCASLNKNWAGTANTVSTHSDDQETILLTLTVSSSQVNDVLILLCSIKLAVFTFWKLHCKFSLSHNSIMVHSILLCAYVQNWSLVSTLF